MKTKLISSIVLALALVAGCAVPVVVKDKNTGALTTNYVANPTALTVANAGNLAAPFVPPPYGTALTAVMTLLAAGAGAIATYQNKKKNENASMLSSVIAGVETAGTPETKAAIQNLASAAGVSAKLDAVVQKVTGTMADTLSPKA